jgi:hypothetical protein
VEQCSQTDIELSIVETGFTPRRPLATETTSGSICSSENQNVTGARTINICLKTCQFKMAGVRAIIAQQQQKPGVYQARNTQPGLHEHLPCVITDSLFSPYVRLHARTKSLQRPYTASDTILQSRWPNWLVYSRPMHWTRFAFVWSGWRFESGVLLWNYIMHNG